MSQTKKWGLVFAIAFLTIGGGYWMYKELSKPLPGQDVQELGREHVTDISSVKYNSNPPTSGSHFPVWAKPGVYDRLISDGYFLHSLEHGYVVISYNCQEKLSTYHFVKEALAHDDSPIPSSTPSASSSEPLTKMTFVPSGSTSWITPETEPKEEEPLPDSFKSDSCKGLVNELSSFTKSGQRVIVAPRQNLDTPLALTAWGRIDKLNKLDKGEIKRFIDAFNNQGPERTME